MAGSGSGVVRTGADVGGDGTGAGAGVVVVEAPPQAAMLTRASAFQFICREGIRGWQKKQIPRLRASRFARNDTDYLTRLFNGLYIRAMVAPLMP
jgi:hypothetical protein